jgi:hypothetical protein
MGMLLGDYGTWQASVELERYVLDRVASAVR